MNTKNTKNTIKEITTETKISDYLGQSIRKWADAYRDAGGKLPKLYYYCDTLPIRSEDGKKVICEGRYKVGCKIDGQPMTFQRFAASYGFKLPSSGSKERCAALCEEYKQALNRTGKYAPKAVKTVAK